MNLNSSVLGIAVALALAGGSAFAAQDFADNTGRGSLLVFPRIDISGDNDTLITIVSDYDGFRDVVIRCFYVAPNPDGYTAVKYVKDFTFRMTHNHPTYWWAKEGGNGAPGFANFPGGKTADRGELKCWAIDPTDYGEIHYNFLSGATSIINTNGQASEYAAFAFPALEGGTGKANAFNKLSTPGTLSLDNKKYEACPNQLLGSFLPGSFDQTLGLLAVNKTRITVAGCVEDLRQDRLPVYTKLNYTFWNQWEESRSGNFECMDSWYETDLDRIYDATYDSLGTYVAYFRAYAAPSKWCGDVTQQVNPGIIGVKQEWTRSGYYKSGETTLTESVTNMRGTHLVGRGNLPGVIWTDLPNTSGAR